MRTCYRRKKRKKRKGLIALVTVLIVILLIHLYFVKFVNPVVYSVAETKIQSLAQKAVNNAVADVINEDISYLDLTNIVYDSNGKITLIQTDSMKLNIIARKTLENVINNLSGPESTDIDIPLGTMSGIPLLTGRGPDIIVKVRPVSASEYKFHSQFTSSGINQTSHRIYFEIETCVKAVLPGRERQFDNIFTVLLTENIIVGEVPSIYLTSGFDILNLIP